MRRGRKNVKTSKRQRVRSGNWDFRFEISDGVRSLAVAVLIGADETVKPTIALIRRGRVFPSDSYAWRQR